MTLFTAVRSPLLLRQPSRLLRSLSSSSSSIGQNVPLAQQALKSCDAVCFDVDSTVIQEEGIDVLGAYLKKQDEIAALTRAAMEGGMPFDVALSKRLELLRPSKQTIMDCLRDHPLPLTPMIDTLIQTLHASNKQVFLVSGGFRIMMEPLAEQLHIHTKTHIYANQILFDSDGQYAGFDTNEPTCRDMGKPKAVQHILDTFDTINNIVMIGDGATDLQAKPPAQAVIGFGGVVIRKAVQEQADWFVTDFGELLEVLKEEP